ncbi:MAG: WD40/YVTN/BNR-like repeat-containing protein [Candidatus Methylomirabilales bacterium]
MRTVALLSGLLLASYIGPIYPVTVNAVQPYKWDTVAIGGGGYVTGIVIHPAEDNLAYIRTDVGGAYRWDEGGRRWIPITDWIPRSSQDFYQVASIAIDPSETRIVYLAAGAGGSLGDVLKSSDGGESFVRTELNVNIKGNAGGHARDRIMGERLAVDPNRASTVYFGSETQGLWRSTQGAAPGTWEKVEGAPNGAAPRGLPFVLFDARRPEVVFVAVYGTGIYQSTDSGSSWRSIGGPAEPTRGAVAPDGTLYVGHKSGVSRYRGGGWRDVTPPSAGWYNGISVDPRDSNIIMAARSVRGPLNPIYRSVDGGASWSQISYRKNSTVPWWPANYWAASTSDLKIDPRFPGRVWHTDWYGIWRTDDVSVNPSIWTNYERGHEEVVSSGTLASPPSGPVILHTGAADVGGFDHVSLAEYPMGSIRAAGLSGMTSTSVDFQESDPGYVVRVGRRGNSGSGIGGYSTNGGQSYVGFPRVPGAGGRVAVSATARRIVWAAQGGGVYVSTNNGASWRAARGAPRAAVGGSTVFFACHPLAADRVNGSKFYLYKSGDLFRSSNGGLDWVKVTSGLPQLGCEVVASSTIAAAPGIEGEVWIGFEGQGLYRSSDSGRTFGRLGKVQSAPLIAFGKPGPSGQPTLFVYGIVDGAEGIFRSEDMGMSWSMLNTSSVTVGNRPKGMAADRRVFGRVYVGTGGRGFFFGEPAGSEP